MNSAGIIKVVTIIVVGILLSVVGLVGNASAAKVGGTWNLVNTPVGSGSAGSGSLAVASWWGICNGASACNGAGAFSGTVGGVQTSGLFSLTVQSPATTPVLPCANGQVSAAGSVLSGSFQGEQVLVAGCIGAGVQGDFVLYHGFVTNAFFSGSGTGTVTVSTSSLKIGFVAAGATSGSGGAGTGTLYTAEADAVTKDGSLVGGGASIGTLSDHIQLVWGTNKASVQPGCTLTTSGVTASFGSFPNQPVSSTYTLTTCPPTSPGPQVARFLYVVGGDISPVYKGTGMATMASFAPKND